MLLVLYPAALEVFLECLERSNLGFLFALPSGSDIPCYGRGQVLLYGGNSLNGGGLVREVEQSLGAPYKFPMGVLYALVEVLVAAVRRVFEREGVQVAEQAGLLVAVAVARLGRTAIVSTCGLTDEVYLTCGDVFLEERLCLCGRGLGGGLEFVDEFGEVERAVYKADATNTTKFSTARVAGVD